MRLVNRLCAKISKPKISTDKVRYKPSVGLEIHAQICSNISHAKATHFSSKMFSSAAFDDTSHVNSSVELFDIAVPGTLPVLNRNSVLRGIQAGVLLNCKIARRCRFERKHYFYADMPSGYQITQQRNPIAHSGYFEYFVHSADQFSAYSTLDKRINVFTCSEGQLRVDANISLASEDSPRLGVRTEVKNINSLKSVYSAINYEISRQHEILKNGGEVLNETRAVDHKGHTVEMREKEIETDYRFMPEPNLPTVVISDELIENVEKNIKRIPKYLHFINEYGFDCDSALYITKDEKQTNFIEAVLREQSGLDVNFLLEWLKELKRICANLNTSYPPTSGDFASTFATLIYLNSESRLTRLTTIDLLKGYACGSLLSTPLEIVEEENLWQINDWNEILNIVDEVFRERGELVSRARSRNARTKCVNKLRNAVIESSFKRIDVQKALDGVMERLKKI
ncbi:unnamed protein product [Anisakis simplex]|uniref:Aspartyl/Glutamyl-tRNA(Gln) amidotransferase subunit B/E catalytic domain-containing protein n=1 Tax=Anisakis simplex TaxID=6269 RepID=A0A0M3K4A3_ANISI|nr:unnamed protein product [Anisakis simplex]